MIRSSGGFISNFGFVLILNSMPIIGTVDVWYPQILWKQTFLQPDALNYTESLIFLENIVENQDTQIRYDGAQLWKLHSQLINDPIVRTLRYRYGGIIWNKNLDGIDMFIGRDFVNDAHQYIRSTDLTYNIMIDDIQKGIEKTRDVSNVFIGEYTKPSQFQKVQKPRMLAWNRYHNLSSIYEFYYQLIEKHPVICSMITIGRTIEGRDIKVIRMSNNNPTNPAVFIESGLQAREWIGPAAATYMINTLIENWNTYPAHVRNLDWYILPVSNPDGYEYTWTTDRLWTKNCRKIKDKKCFGVNLDRNFAYQWGKTGSARGTCSRFYRGSEAFSEAETKAIKNQVTALSSKLYGYISIGAYGQLVTYPYGDDDFVPNDEDELRRIAMASIRNIRKVAASEYHVGSSYQLSLANAGNSADWVKQTFNITYVYNLILKDQGMYGFLLPPYLIEETGEESIRMLLTISYAISQTNPKEHMN